MTPQERRVMDNLVTAVDFLLSDTPRSGRYNEVKAIRETLQEANADLKKAELEVAIGETIPTDNDGGERQYMIDAAEKEFGIRD